MGYNNSPVPQRDTCPAILVQIGTRQWPYWSCPQVVTTTGHQTDVLHTQCNCVLLVHIPLRSATQSLHLISLQRTNSYCQYCAWSVATRHGSVTPSGHTGWSSDHRQGSCSAQLRAAQIECLFRFIVRILSMAVGWTQTQVFFNVFAS